MSADPSAGDGPHQPVLYDEIIHALAPHSEGRYVDCTVGAGGHASGILKTSAPGGYLLGLDRDLQILEYARARLAQFAGRFELVHGSFTWLAEQVRERGWLSVDGLLIDLGVSSLQLDRPDRGFSFRSDGPLDMRFDQSAPITAEELVNGLGETELADLIYRYGDERKSRSIARAIARERPVRTTHQLADIVRRAVRGKRGRIHPATRTFQALRIAVNGELDALSAVLPQAVEVLRPGGRMAIISFHSLEDRLVKNFFRESSRDCICPPAQPICTCDHSASIKLIGKRPVRPSEEEARINPRARSARLRVAEKLG